MTTWKQLSPPLRLVIVAPWLLIAALATSASIPAFRQLVLDSAGKPTADVSLASPHWVDTLDAARLPANVAVFDESANLLVLGNLLCQNAVVTPQIYGNGDPTIDLADSSTGYLRDDGDPVLAWSYGGVNVEGYLIAGGGLSTDSNQLTTDGNGNVTVQSLHALNRLAIASSDFYVDSIGNVELINADGGGTLNVQGLTYLDNGYIATSGYGDFYASSSVVTCNLNAQGALSTDNGTITTDGAGDMGIGGSLSISDWLVLGNEATPGTIVPDKTLVLYDSDQVPYLIPCKAKP